MLRPSRDLPGDEAPLFTPPLPAKRKLPIAATSRAAHARVRWRLRERHVAVLRLLRDRDLAVFQVAEALASFDHVISPRYTELARLGLIERTGRRTTKPATGCACDVFQITPEGRRRLAQAEANP